MAMKRREASREFSGDGAILSRESFMFGYPCVLEFVCRSAWEDGSLRSTGTVMVMVDAGQWKLWAHDRDMRSSLFLSGPTLKEAFSALEGHLERGTGDWRPDRPEGNRKK
jgi:hypothetical protein